MTWAEHVSRLGEKVTLIGYWLESHRERSTWVDNIKVDLGDIGCDGMDWIGLAADGDRWRALVNAVMNLRFP
jgi:hypothetical protein